MYGGGLRETFSRFSSCAGTTKKNAPISSNRITPRVIRIFFFIISELVPSFVSLCLCGSQVLSLGDHAVDVSISSRAEFVILASDLFIGLAKLFDVDLRELDHTHLDEGFLYARTPKSNVLDRRHDSRKEHLCVLLHERRNSNELHARIGAQSEIVPDLFAHKTVSHEIIRLNRELFAFISFLLGQLRIVVAQREPAERDVARFVLHNVCRQRLSKWLGRQVPNRIECRKREAFDDHLHGKIREVPTRI